MDKFFKQTKAIWQDLLSNNSDVTPFEQLFEQLHYLKFAEANSSVIYVFNAKEFKNEYISTNVKEVLGYVGHEDSVHYFFDKLAPNHADFPLILTQLQTKAFQKMCIEDRKHTRLTACGMAFQHAEKGWIRILFQTVPLEMSEDQTPLRSMVVVHDITHLIKEDFYWTRVVYGEEKTCINGYLSATKEEVEGDIISKREKEVLQLIAAGKSTTEIAKSLFISPNTLNNHRQNLLNKIGAKDTTALVHLARITGLI